MFYLFILQLHKLIQIMRYWNKNYVTDRKFVEPDFLREHGTPSVVYRWRHFDDVTTVGGVPLRRDVRYSNKRRRIEIL